MLIAGENVMVTVQWFCHALVMLSGLLHQMVQSVPNALAL